MIFLNLFFYTGKSQIINNNINDKDSYEFKNKLKKAFEKINEDFLIMSPIFIPLIPGNDPNNLFNEEKQI